MHRWIEVQGEGNCPCCYTKHTLSVQKPSSVLTKVLGRVIVKCSVCLEMVHIDDIHTHLASRCKKESTIDLSVSDILSQSLTTPTPTERQLASNLVRRMMAATLSDSVQITTGGQVRNIRQQMHINYTCYSHSHLSMFHHHGCHLEKPVPGHFIGEAMNCRVSTRPSTRMPAQSSSKQR